MIEVGSSVMILPHNSIAFKGRTGVVVKIIDGSPLPYRVFIGGVDMTVLFSEDDLVELPDQ